ncbi:MAG: T9SS type A sorting domain-containing protein [Bacteroidetes bacterium]|nr:T9SS type A sorting domain-containing protein [Bacteroidota bacterium]
MQLIVDSLIIEAGVLVQFQAGGWMIQVGGGARFLANGTIEDPIVFEPYQGNEPGLWDKIFINESGDDDTLKYCRIRNAVNGINVKNSNTVVYGCEIFGSLTGIRIYSSSYSFANIINCTLFNNSYGIDADGYWSWNNADATITNSIVAYNGTHGIKNSSGGIIGANDIIYNCFWDNGLDNFSGITIPSGFGSNGNFQNYNGDSCDVNFNIYYDPYFVDTTNANFNLIPNSKCIDAGTNLILGEFTYDPDGTMPDMGANYYPHSNAAILTYSFPQQTGPAVIEPEDKEITIEVVNGTNVTNLIAEFNLSGGASATVNGTPQISEVTENDFTFPVTYVVTADNGDTQEWLVTVNIATGINEILIENINIYPNPFSNKTTIKFPNPNHSNYLLSVFSISGNKIFEMDNIQSDKIEFERGNLPKGVYLIELKGEKVFRGKMVVR